MSFREWLKLTNVHEGGFLETVRTPIPLDAPGLFAIDYLMHALIAVITPTTNIRVVRSELGVIEDFVPILGTIAPNLGTRLSCLEFITLLFLHTDKAF